MLILGIVAILRETNEFLSAQSPVRLVALSFLFIMVIGAIDHLIGYELSFSFFYLIPVSFGSWYLGQRIGLIICVVSAATWLGVDYTSGHQYSNPAIYLWNAGIRLGFFVVVVLLLEGLRRALERQESLAQLDGLTGIMNALTFRQRCDSSFGLAFRHGHPLTIGYLDLDNFKGVNDSLGHSVGDQVLKAVATALTKQLRVSDIGARLGGDEFAILLPETDLAGARTFFTKLREMLIDLSALNRWPVGFSIGVAVFHPPPANPEDAIRCADDLMYRVKRSGKNNILFEEYTGVSSGAELSR